MGRVRALTRSNSVEERVPDPLSHPSAHSLRAQLRLLMKSWRKEPLRSPKGVYYRESIRPCQSYDP